MIDHDIGAVVVAEHGVNVPENHLSEALPARAVASSPR